MTTYVCRKCSHNTNRASRICRDCNIENRKRWDGLEDAIVDSHHADQQHGQYIALLRQLDDTEANRVRRYFVRRLPELVEILADQRLPARCRKYKLTVGRWMHLVATQHSRCAICDTQLHPLKLHIDHDHTTGAVRGLLCNTCNTGLGLLRIDGPDATRRTEAVTAYMRIAKQAHSISTRATA